jgi:hypothetical protein
MELSRRQFVLAGFGLAAAGCTGQSVGVLTPKPTWPDARLRPRPQGRQPFDATTSAQSTALPPAPQGTVKLGALDAIPRWRWAKYGPVLNRLNPLGSIGRITVHHEGHKPVTFSDWASTAARMDTIRRSHLDRSFGDIGYHFVVDRAGRIWEGRHLRFQGAHVSKHNENNLGLMVLGNFDEQRPSTAQIAKLNEILPRLMHFYRVPRSQVFTHQELMPTTCPGRILQRHMVHARNSHVLG